MENALEKKITIFSLIKYTLPTVIMMVFFSTYTIIDGMFISNYVGSNALAATNVVFPVINIVIGIGIMFATGGSAIVAKSMGEKDVELAKEKFTFITIVTILIGLAFELICILFLEKIIYLLGSTDILYPYAKDYLLYMLLFTPFIILKVYFDYFLVTAGAANLGLISSVGGGIINIVLDYMFMAKLGLGVKGAALATCIGYVLPSFIAIIYFFNKKNVLHFVKPKKDMSVIVQSCSNGISEMVNQISSGITTFLFNIVIIKFLGEDGIAAVTVILYMQFLLNSAYLGFVSGVSPRISYNYGKKDSGELHKLLKYSLIIIGVFGIIISGVSVLLSDTLISLFASKGTDLYDITTNGFMLFSISFIFSGINIFTSGMFTAYSNGKISAMISLLRTLVFFVIGIAVLPSLIGLNGVWLVVPVANILTSVVSFIYMYKYKKVYLYEKPKKLD
ncbi:MAG: MATE family efflux transporter, partial [Peptostreptococcaceae bacterium]